MNRDRHERAARIFHEAVSLSGEAREVHLTHACGEDRELREHVERLLAHDAEDGDEDDFFAEERLGVGREVIANALADEMEGGATPLPERIGRFRILDKLGEGGMGAVYLAEQDHPRRRVALKVIRPDALSPGLLKRFQFEVDLLGRLQHPGIAQIHEAGERETESGGVPYFAMEYVDGVALRRSVTDRRLDVRSRLELVARVCEAVHHAHLKGIVHRDLKPENILVVEEDTTAASGESAEFARLGRPKVLDFGVARASDVDVQATTVQTSAGQLIGTVRYMSPEQVEGDSLKIDARSDIYSLGVILYELLAGRPPHDLGNRSIPEAVRIIREEEPTRLASIDTAFRGDIDTVVGTALEKDRERRYASAAELAADLRRCLLNRPVAARPPSAIYQVVKFGRRHKGLVVGLALASLVLLAGAITSLSFASRATRGERRALENEAAAHRATERLNVMTAAAIGEREPRRALEHLESVPPEHRGWEWRHLRSRFLSHVVDFPLGPEGVFPSLFGAGEGGELLAPLERNGAVEVFDLGSGARKARIEGPERILPEALSADGSTLTAWRGPEGIAAAWKLTTGERLPDLPVRLSHGEGCCLPSPDGSRIALVSNVEGLTLVESATGRVLFRRAPELGDLWRLAFSPSGDRVAMRAGGVLEVRAIDGEVLAATVPEDGVFALAFSPDGRHLAVGYNQRAIGIRDAGTLEELQRLYGHDGQVTALAFSPDGSLLASASTDGTRLWELPEGRNRRVLVDLGGAEPVRALSFSPDGCLLASGGDGGVRVWEVETEPGRVLEGHGTYVYHVTFSSDGSLLASAGFQSDARLWDPSTGELLQVIPAAAASAGLAFSEDGARLITYVPQPKELGAGDGSFHLWDPATGERVAEPRSERDEILFRQLGGPSSYITRFFRGTAANAKLIQESGERLALAPDRSFFANALGNSGVRLVSLVEEGVVRRICPEEGELYSVAIGPDGLRLATGDGGGAVKLWDVDSGAELARLEGHEGVVYSLSFHPDGSRLVSGGNDGNLVLWDLATFEPALTLQGHRSYVHSVCFSPDGTQLASASGDGTIRIWDSVSPAERWRAVRGE